MTPRYKRMLDGMKRKEDASRKRPQEKWFLYVLQCGDETLYTGITNDLDRRFKMHCSGKATRYTRTRLPVRMVYLEPCKSRTAALIREYAVKSLPKAKKLLLIN